MRILFIHQNFPGQFVHLASALQARGHEVMGLTGDDNATPTTLPFARYKWTPREPQDPQFKLASTFAKVTYRGEITSTAAATLRDKHNYVPDVVFGTPGWGEMLFLRQVWPGARHLLYGEFFFGPQGPMIGFDRELSKGDLASRIAASANSAHLVLSANAADKVLVATQWQARSFPAYLQEKISVIHDGIDTDRVCPSAAATVKFPEQWKEFKTGDEVLTFVNRNHEPHRGFHIFMRALPKILEARPQAQVVIVGGDEQSYSPRPGANKTWRQVMLAEVGDRLDLSRVHFVGKIPYATFIDLLRVSRVHAYLTYPFVLSWSMMEAMSAGCVVIGSRTPPVEEVIRDGINGRLVDFFDVAAWSEALIDALAQPEKYAHLRPAARRTIVESYDLRKHCLPRLVEFVERA